MYNKLIYTISLYYLY